MKVLQCGRLCSKERPEALPNLSNFEFRISDFLISFALPM